MKYIKVSLTSNVKGEASVRIQHIHPDGDIELWFGTNEDLAAILERNTGSDDYVYGINNPCIKCGCFSGPNRYACLNCHRETVGGQ